MLSLTEREPWDTVELVASGQADVGVAHSWGDVTLDIPEHLETTSLADDVADVIVPVGHRLAKRRRVSPHDLVDESWIATPEGTICREWLSRMYLGTGRQPRIAHESLEFQSHLALVAAGLGIALVPRLGREELGAGLVAVRAHDPVPTRNIVAVHRRSMSESPAVRAVVAALAGGPARLDWTEFTHTTGEHVVTSRWPRAESADSRRPSNLLRLAPAKGVTPDDPSIPAARTRTHPRSARPAHRLLAGRR